MITLNLQFGQSISTKWLKVGSVWQLNALETIDDPKEGYVFMIEKDKNGLYQVFATEHDPEDLDCPGFKYLKDAKEFAIEQAEYFADCWLQNLNATVAELQELIKLWGDEATQKLWDRENAVMNDPLDGDWQ